jgi:hypothetical protein
MEFFFPQGSPEIAGPLANLADKLLELLAGQDDAHGLKAIPDFSFAYFGTHQQLPFGAYLFRGKWFIGRGVFSQSLQMQA